MLPSVWKNRGSLGVPTFDDLFERIFYDWPAVTRSSEAVWTPRVDISETEKEVLVDLELPGIDKKDIKVEVKNNVLTVSGERKDERKTDEKGYRSVERHYGRFERSFTLPETVDAEKIAASYANGVMTLTLPKVEKALPREINVEVK